MVGWTESRTPPNKLLTIWAGQFSDPFSQWVKKKHVVVIPEKSQAQYHGVLTLTKSLIQDSRDPSPFEKERRSKEKFLLFPLCQDSKIKRMTDHLS